MREQLLGVDIGTRACKCSLIDAQGQILSQALEEYSPALPQAG